MHASLLLLLTFVTSALASGCGSQSPSAAGGSTAPPLGTPPPAGTPPPSLLPTPNGVDVEYSPCAGKTCGESCTVCSPRASDCMETMVVKQCNAQGQCTSDPVDCPK